MATGLVKDRGIKPSREEKLVLVASIFFREHEHHGPRPSTYAGGSVRP
nr:hypothetical protein [Arthrobacter sp. SX1312]